MAREVRSNGDTIRAKEFALDEMKLGFAELTNHLTTGGVDTMVTLSFEKLYRNVYRAITHGLGNDWFEIVRSAAQRIVFRFRNNHHRYDTCAEVMRDISMFAEVTFCVANRKRGDYRVRTTFARVWDEWHADKELRSWILWRPVRAVRVKLAILAWALKTYEEVSLRPENTGYAVCKERFDAGAKQQVKKRKRASDRPPARAEVIKEDSEALKEACGLQCVNSSMRETGRY